MSHAAMVVEDVSTLFLQTDERVSGDFFKTLCWSTEVGSSAVLG
jgi:hypothetical protein